MQPLKCAKIFVLLEGGVSRHTGYKGEDALANPRRVEFRRNAVAHDEASIRYACSEGALGEQRQHLRRHDKMAGAVVGDAREDGAAVDLARSGIEYRDRTANVYLALRIAAGPDYVEARRAIDRQGRIGIGPLEQGSNVEGRRERSDVGAPGAVVRGVGSRTHKQRRRGRQHRNRHSATQYPAVEQLRRGNLLAPIGSVDVDERARVEVSGRVGSSPRFQL